MKKNLKIILFIFFPAIVNAQLSFPDSLHYKLSIAANDSVRMDLNDRIALYYGEINHDSTLLYRDVALTFARKLNLKIDEADILTGKGYILQKMGRLTESLECLTEAITILENPDNDENPYPFSNPQGKGGTRLATLSDAKLMLADLYALIGDKEKPIPNYLESIRLSRIEKDTSHLSLSLLELGRYYGDVGNYDSALYYLQQSEVFFSPLSKYKCALDLVIARIYINQKKYPLANEKLTQSMQSAKETDNIVTLGDIYLEFAKLYQLKNQPDSVFNYASHAFDTYQITKNSDGISEAASILAGIFKIRSETDSAYKYLQLSTSIKDSLFKKQKEDLSNFQNNSFKQQQKVFALEKEKEDNQTRVRFYVLIAGLATLLIIGLILYRNNRHKQKANKILQQQKVQIESSLNELKSTQAQLIQKEKMASLGELTAGIAHEIQNPLNFVNNFSEVSNELIDEIQEERTKKKEERDEELVGEILDDIKQNLEKINHHGKRAGEIVKGMLQHSRTSSGQKEPTDINKLADEYLRLAYHGLRAKDKSFNAAMETDFDGSIPMVDVVPQDIGRVILNLITNAFYAAPLPPKGGVKDPNHKPTIWVSTKRISPLRGDQGGIEIRVKDNGPGIPKEILDKIFQPFFTTKPTGQGTGLGLSLSYDIVKAHGGEIKVESKEGEQTTFIIQIPTNTKIG